MPITEFRITRFQFKRDRVIGDSQVRIDSSNIAALELVSDSGNVGLGFYQSLFHPLPAKDEIDRIFSREAWPQLDGQEPLGLVHRVNRPRGGNNRAYSLPFDEAIQVALWDLAAKQVGMPLYRLLGGRRSRVKAYASGLDFNLDDHEFQELFGQADAAGYDAFKIKVGHEDFDRDLGRLELLRNTVRRDATFMIDANEAWGAKEASIKIDKIHKLGYNILWVEDPILRDDFEGLRMLRASTPWTQINSGEYLEVDGKRQLMMAGATDMLNAHGKITDVMYIGRVAAELGIPVTLGNTLFELGVHTACALPEVGWLENSFMNYNHLVEQPVEFRDGWAIAPDHPGHGIELSNAARTHWSRPDVLPDDALGSPPPRDFEKVRELRMAGTA